MFVGYGVIEIVLILSNVYWLNDIMGLIGLLLFGNIFKLVLVGEKFEFWVKGVNVMLGYYCNLEKFRVVFDEEGFYWFGDVVWFVDLDDLGKGFVFDGCIVEEFKLVNGIWVFVGKLCV